MAACGWDGQEKAARGDACRRAGVNLVADNLREHAADLHTALTLYEEAQGRIFQGVDVEGRRREITRGKDEGLPRLEELYQAFKAKAEAAGVTGHLAATGLVGEEGVICRWTFFHSVGMCAIIAVLTLLQVYWFKFMLP